MKANRGAAGIDGVETGDFPAFMREHWEKIRGKLEAGDYKPAPVRRVSICLPSSGPAVRLAQPGARSASWQSKDGGGTRSLGIPTVLDRLIQQAIAQVLTPLYEPLFSEHSHGFYPSCVGLCGEASHSGGTSCQAVARTECARCHRRDGGGREEKGEALPRGRL